MRRILIDSARRKRAEKRGGGRNRVDLDAGRRRRRRPAGRPARPRRGPRPPGADDDAVRPPARQAPLLRRADRRAGRRGARHLRARPPIASWAFARAWLRCQMSGEGDDAGCEDAPARNVRGFETDPGTFSALAVDVRSRRGTDHERELRPNAEEIFLRRRRAAPRRTSGRRTSTRPAAATRRSASRSTGS